MKFVIALSAAAAMFLGTTAIAGATTFTRSTKLPGHHALAAPAPKAAAVRLRRALAHPHFAKTLSARQRAVLKKIRRLSAINSPAKAGTKARASDVYIAFVLDAYVYTYGPIAQGMDWYEYYSPNIGYYYESYEWSYDGATGGFVYDGVDNYYWDGLFFGPYRLHRSHRNGRTPR
jgi:hypothetical protein